MSQKSVRQIQMIDIQSITVFERNPRKISEEQFEKLCLSVKENPDFFKSRPVLLNQTPEGQLIAYAGVHRLKAAIVLGWEKVPAIVESISAAEMDERCIKDNTHQAEWDSRLLADFDEVFKLTNWGIPVDAFKDFNSSVDLFNVPEEQPEPKPRPISFGGEKSVQPPLGEEAYFVATGKEQPTYEGEIPESPKEGKINAGLEEDYEYFSLVLTKVNKTALMNKLNELKRDFMYEKLEDALMHLVRGA